jgi:HSP20 family molecular chaperone IbpA
MKNKNFILLASILTIALTPTASRALINRTQVPNSENLDRSIANNFEEMQKIMEKQSQQHRERLQNAFKNSEPNNSLTSKTKVSSNEDEDNYYYELEFFGVKKEEINVAIHDNILTFSATQKVEKNKKFSGANFYYSLAAGDFDKAVEPEIRRMDDRIIVKLKKNKKK